MTFEKKNRSNIGAMLGHNLRTHPTSSQIPDRSAWFTKDGILTVVSHNEELLQNAKKLAKRKDAVLAIEFVFQLGDQSYWREPPTQEYAYGKPLHSNIVFPRMNLFIHGIMDAVSAVFGKERIMGAYVHLDESSPHLHVPIAPVRVVKHKVRQKKNSSEPQVFEEKQGLQAKYWIGGPQKISELCAEIHRHVNLRIACWYEKGAPGGLPHDARRAAGGVMGPKPVRSPNEADSSESRIDDLEDEVRGLKSALKNATQYGQKQFETAKFATLESKKDSEALILAKMHLEQMKIDLEDAKKIEEQLRNKVAALEENLKLSVEAAQYWEQKVKMIFDQWRDKQLRNIEAKAEQLKSEESKSKISKS